MRVLNLYSGLGGNRKLWKDVSVTAVESDNKILGVYQDLFPNDEVILGDAHQYLLNNFNEYDFIWSSPPCQSHSRMAISGQNRKKNRYPDLKLYEEILLLKHQFKGKWVVENVIPYYKPLITPTGKVGRHLFWSNFDFKVEDVPWPKGTINKTNTAGSEALKDFLGIHYKGNIYYEGNHCPAQVLRNCVNPKVGLDILKATYE